jgi:hypothetical protein
MFCRLIVAEDDALCSIFEIMKMDCVHPAIGGEASSECKLQEHVRIAYRYCNWLLGVEAEGVKIVRRRNGNVIANRRRNGRNRNGRNRNRERVNTVL